MKEVEMNETEGKNDFHSLIGRCSSTQQHWKGTYCPELVWEETSSAERLIYRESVVERERERGIVRESECERE